MKYSYRGVRPVIHPSVFVADGARIIGDVEIAEDSSVWFNSVIRGDVNSVRIGARTNVQDGCLLHVRHETSPLSIGSDVTLGHGAIVHGCTVHDTCLIGIGAIVLDNAEINSYTLLAAGSVVRPGVTLPGGTLVAGVPARVVRDLSLEERVFIEESAKHYVEYVKTYRESTV